MKIAYVVVRYGTEVVGGAEQGCRLLAERIAQRPGWTAEVFTTCALDATTWADHYPPGTSTIGGVTVHRFASRSGRDRRFDAFSAGVLVDPEHVTNDLQERWLTLQGPVCPDAVDAAIASDADLVVLTPYLFWPTVAAVTRLNGRAVMHPAAHDEAPIRLPVFREIFPAVKGLVFYTDAERRLVERLFPSVAAAHQLVLGLGVEPGAGDPGAFRAAYGLGSAPFLLCLGRVDDGKGAAVLARFFEAYKRRRAGPLKLVFMGPVVNPPPTHPDTIVTGPVDETTKWGALTAAAMLVSPSPNESFSLALLEAWAAGTPAIVNDRCAPTVEHARRSGGGVPFSGYASFEAIVDRFMGDEELRTALGHAGRAYVAANFNWPTLIERYVRFLERVK